MPDIPLLLQVAQHAKRQIDDVLLAVQVQADARSRTAATLCLTIAEQFSAACSLIEGGFSSHAPIIVRSMLEAFANLLNLVADAAYLDQLRFENARGDIVLFDEYSRLPDMQADDQAMTTLAVWKAQAEPIRDELRARGFQKIEVLEKFRRAGILDNYVAYRVFCSFAHSQLTTLLARHDGDFDLRYHHDAPNEMTASLLTVGLSILCRAIVTLPHYSNASQEQLQALVDAIDAAWGEARA